MIIFKKLNIEGFGVFAEPFSIKLDQPGLNVLALPNGSGKSTIFGALVWALYGKPLKDKSTVVTYVDKRPLTWMGTKVEIFFIKDGVKYSVTRCRDYKGKVNEARGKNGLFITIGGAPFNDERDKRDVQKVLENLIGYSYELFTNTVIFPQRAKRFVEESGTDKRRIFEEVFNLDWISKASEEAKDKRTSIKLEKTKAQGQLDTLNASRKGYDEFLTHLKKSKEDFNQAKAAKVAEIEANIKSIESRIGFGYKDPYAITLSISDMLAQLEEINNDPNYKALDRLGESVSKWNSLRDKLTLTISKAKESVEYYNNPLTEGICPTCKQPLPHKQNKVLTDDAKLELGEAQSQLEDVNKVLMAETLKHNKGTTLRKKFFEVQSNLNEYQSQLRIIDTHNRALDKSMVELEGLKTQLADEKNSTFKDISHEISDKIKTLDKDLRVAKVQVKNLTSRENIYNWLITKPLSEAGLKSYIINSMIESLNDRLKFYRKYVNFGVKLEVDMSGARKDINTIIKRGDFPVLLEDLSGGERQLVHIVIAFALTDLISLSADSSKTNLSVFDEVFESLDSNNTEIVSDLIQSRVESNTSIFIITHKLDFVLRNANNINL